MISFRVDDFPGTKPTEFWRHNLDNYKIFEEIFTQHHADLMLGVIPRHTTQAHIDHFRSSPTTYVALHGIDHDERFPNEFRDHQTEDEVYQAICSASEPLKVCNPSGKVDTYIPPHNVIDTKTVNALVRAGFRTLYSGPESDVAVLEYAKSKGLHVLRHMPPAYARSDEMLKSGIIDQILSGKDTHLALHWTWEWNIGLDSLREFMKRIDPEIGHGRWY